MSDGIAEMNRVQITRDRCLECSTSFSVVHDCMCGKNVHTPLATASAELAEKGTPLVADAKSWCIDCCSFFNASHDCTCGECNTGVESVRTFDTGATRDTAEGKPRYHAYNCPLVEQKYGEYMLKHQKQSDGSMRPADNWKNGFPLEELLESLIRHVKDLELHYDGYVDQCREKDIHEVLGGIRANVTFYQHEILKETIAD